MNEKEQKILETAIELVYKNGLSKTNANRVAAAMGIRSSLVYYYFPKESVLFEKMLAFIIHTNNSVVQQMTDALGKVSRREQISLYLKHNLAWGYHYPAQTCVLLNGFIDGCHDSFVNQLLKKALTAGEEKVYSYLVAGSGEDEFKVTTNMHSAAKTIHQGLMGALLHQLLFQTEAESNEYLHRLEETVDRILEPKATIV